MTSCSYHIIFLLPGKGLRTRHVKGECDLDSSKLDAGAFGHVVQVARNTDPDLADASVLSISVTKVKP